MLSDIPLLSMKTWSRAVDFSSNKDKCYLSAPQWRLLTLDQSFQEPDVFSLWYLCFKDALINTFTRQQSRWSCDVKQVTCSWKPSENFLWPCKSPQLCRALQCCSSFCLKIQQAAVLSKESRPHKPTVLYCCIRDRRIFRLLVEESETVGLKKGANIRFTVSESPEIWLQVSENAFLNLATLEVFVFLSAIAARHK